MKKTYKCPCQEGTHTIDLTTPVYKTLYHIIKQKGELVNCSVIGTPTTFKVPRIFIAMHGLKAKDLPNLHFKTL